MIIIGERLNSSRRAVHDALAGRDETYLVEQAKLQEKAGASYIDLNASALLDKELETLGWAIPLLQESVSIPLALDTPDPRVMEAALKLHRGRPLLNSLTGEKAKAESLLPLIKDFKPRVIVLCLDDKGIPAEAGQALSVAQRMAELLGRQGLGQEDIFVDPLVRPLGVDSGVASLFLESLEIIKKKLSGAKTVAGLSNVSFGLPDRRLLNRTFLVLAMKAGLDAAICDPLDKELRAALAAASALLGRDPFLRDFLRFFRESKESGRR
jgi:5-methyltetrahydrofolate--homocysteine methyltransferase